MSYILIPRIEVFGANAQSAYTVVSGPSPLAFLGMIRKLAIDCGKLKNSEKIRVAIIHHNMEMRGEPDYHYKPAQYRGASLTSASNGGSTDYVAGSLSMSLQPTALCNLTVSLIVSGLNGVSAKEIHEKLLFSRCAGGHIRNVGYIKEYDSLARATKAVGKGYFVLERQDILNVSAEEKPAAIIYAITKREEGDGWILPMNLGFLAVTPFVEKASARGGFKHAFAEPLLGVIQYKTRHALIEEKKEIPFWHYSVNGNAFTATTNL